MQKILCIDIEYITYTLCMYEFMRLKKVNASCRSNERDDILLQAIKKS